MKRLTILYLLFMAGACQPQGPEEKFTVPQSLEKSDSIVQTSVEEVVDKSLVDAVPINWDFIKSQTFPISENINVSRETEKELKLISKEFAEKVFINRRFSNGYPEKLNQEYYPWAYKFGFYKEYPKFNLFTILYQDEYCCVTEYAITLPKDSLEPINIVSIAFDGADGGWVGASTGIWIDDYLISKVEHSIYDEDFDENTDNIEIDTTWSELRLSELGIFELQKLDSSKYIGSRKKY